MASKNHKYNLKGAELKSLYTIADMALHGNYHNVYERLGLKKGTNGNFQCVCSDTHGRGTDNHPSMSIDNDTGRFHCFTCSIKGNFNSFYKNFLSGSGNYPESYTDFIIDFLNLQNRLTSSEDLSSENQEKISDIHEHLNELKTAYRSKYGVDFIPSKDSTDALKEIVSIPMINLVEWNKALLENKGWMDFLKDTRNIDDKVVKKYMLGLHITDHGYEKIVFPQIDAEGAFVNAKLYDPKAKNPDFKWMYLKKGNPTRPSPIGNLMGSKIYIFEGEPDTYCAIGFGLNAATLGPASVTNVDEVFGENTAKILFSGKEIVICLDADKAGMDASKKLAKSLYKYAKQIKIIDLSIRDGNPYGLPPDEHEVVRSDGSKKFKKTYKDFTDFTMKINGGGTDAIERFLELENNTEVYTENDPKSLVEIFKVTLQEARNPRYHSTDGTKVLELIAAVAEFDPKSFLYATSLQVSCPCMNNAKNLQGRCKNCSVTRLGDFGEIESAEIFLDRMVPSEHKSLKNHIEISEHEILGLIQVTEIQKNKNLRKICGFHEYCSQLRISEKQKEKLINVKLVNDIDEQQSSDAGSADIDMAAYMLEKDIYANRSYKFQGVQTTAWDGQHAVLFLNKAEPVMTSIESYKNDEGSIAALKAIQPEDGDTIEGIEAHLSLRYKVLGDAAGLTGRSDLFLANDIVFFSQAEINNQKLLPSIKRGFVEWLICGDTRCGKTVASKSLHRHYHVGETIGGSSAVSRSGLIGGVEKGAYSQKSTICWGKIPMNDRGLVIIDELSNIDTETLNSLTDCRSEGVVQIGKIRSGRAQARTRKIMLSNDPDPTAQYGGSKATEGMPLLLRVCRGKPEILARFDGASIVKRDDVPYEDFNASYQQVQTIFTECQEHYHIMFVWSRTPENIIYENGIEEHINKAQEIMLSRFHASTQLVNQEIRAKLVRIALSIAGILVSTSDYENLIVKKVHVDFAVKMLTSLYSSKNMNLDIFSKIQIASECLGDMRFMENIMKYVDLYSVMNIDEVNEMSLFHIFNDYVQRVSEGKVSIVDAMTDENKTSGGIRPIDVLHKLVGIMVTRNCLIRTKHGRYRKTSMFDRWLNKRLEMGKHAPTSNILENLRDKRNSAVDEAVERFDSIGGPVTQQSAG